jgi:hypothetical protein
MLEHKGADPVYAALVKLNAGLAVPVTAAKVEARLTVAVPMLVMVKVHGWTLLEVDPVVGHKGAAAGWSCATVPKFTVGVWRLSNRTRPFPESAR